MKCPIDKSDMIVVEHEKIEIDHCLRCSGVWFDSGELELLVSMLKAEGASPSQTELLTPNEVKASEAGRKCPICGRRMAKVCLGNTTKVIVDSCPRGDGLWFDSGEMHHVLGEIEPSKTQASRDVISFLGNAFKFTQEMDRKE